MIKNGNKRTWKNVINGKAISAANIIWSLYFPIMLDTLLLRPSLHFTPLQYTCRHFTSSHLNFTQIHFTTHSFGLILFKFPTAPFHLTSHHYTSAQSLHCAYRWFSPHFYSFHFTSFTIYFLNLNYVCTAVLTLDAGLLARSQNPEGPATGHLDTGFSWFPCVYKRMLRLFSSSQVATTCLSCSPPDLNFLVTFYSIFVYM
jgi:hypothetical protein